MKKQRFLVSQSLFYPNTYYVFREIGDDQYTEIEVKINRVKNEIQSSQLLTIEEKEFIQMNILLGKVINVNSMINDNKKYVETFKKTYHEHSK